MIGLDEARLLVHVARWRLTWDKYDSEHLPAGLGPKFVSARSAAELIDDGNVVISCGMAAHHRASILYWAIRDRFQRSGHPRDLTWCGVGALGGRGRVPGTLEELGIPGLVSTAILGHLETVKSFLTLAESHDLELHTLPQGELAFLIEGQGDGRLSRESPVGVGSFLDPRVGAGSPVTENARMQLIEALGDQLRYRLPRLDVALFNAPYADPQGNIYVTGAACLTEIHDSARAVHANAGTVIACVADVIEPIPGMTYVPSEWVDAVVVNPRNEQTGSIPQRRYWSGFTVEGDPNPARVMHNVRFLNRVLRITPRRSAADEALARLTASVIAERLSPGALINLGVGLPEEAGRLLGEEGLDADPVKTTEAGAIGGTPASGIFFGAAVNPLRLESSAEMFHRYECGLDLACLGILQVDGAGNVNVSRRGNGVTTCVGPGGLPDITHHARTLVFVGSFAHHERLELDGGLLHVVEQGEAKFVDRVREITFEGTRALRRGQTVIYVTHRAIFRLTDAGLTLTHISAGVDRKKTCSALPAPGSCFRRTVRRCWPSGRAEHLPNVA
jgi:propionate CoA-transferase